MQPLLPESLQTARAREACHLSQGHQHQALGVAATVHVHGRDQGKGGGAGHCAQCGSEPPDKGTHRQL